MYVIVISRIAEKQIATFPRHVANSVVAKIDALKDNPRPHGSKKLEGSDMEYRIRSGDYRIIYRIEDSKLFIEVIRVGHRRDVYKNK